MLDARGQSFDPAAHRFHPEHGHQDADIGQDDESERQNQSDHTEGGGHGPLQSVVVTGQSKHRGVVTEIAHHPDGLAIRQSSHYTCCKPYDAQSKGPSHGHNTKHAPRCVDRVLPQGDAYCDQPVIGKYSQSVRLQRRKKVVGKHLQQAQVKRDKVVFEEEYLYHAGNGARVQGDIDHRQVDDTDKLWSVQATIKGDDIDQQAVEHQCDHIDEHKEDEVDRDVRKRLKSNDIEAWRVNDERVV